MPASPEDLEIFALFEVDAPPRHDHSFVLLVAERVARHRLIEELVGWGVGSVLVAMVLWAIGPVLASFAKPAGVVLTLLLPPLSVIVGVLILVHPRTHHA